MEVSGSHWKPTTACVCSRRELSGAIESHWESVGAVGVNYVSLPNQSTCAPAGRVRDRTVQGELERPCSLVTDLGVEVNPITGRIH